MEKSSPALKTITLTKVERNSGGQVSERTPVLIPVNYVLYCERIHAYDYGHLIYPTIVTMTNGSEILVLESLDEIQKAMT